MAFLEGAGAEPLCRRRSGLAAGTASDMVNRKVAHENAAHRNAFVANSGLRHGRASDSGGRSRAPI